ncbi:MAG: hypothetical protein ASARMPRED_007491 [Alectoria sarmentosa]|nr:MAG: hypothetical protein ASARMPRED_007491 [Alectoria sarmentosa]
MLASGFTAAPVSQFLFFGVIASSILVSITDTKYLFYIQVVPHLWQYKQAWRLLIWQSCYNNSTELLFAAMSLYHLRIIERLWGPRKFASFLFSVLPPTLLLPPIVTTMLRPLTFGAVNHLPAGPTPLIFALLAQYHAAIPTVYKYRIVTSKSPSTSSSASEDHGPVLSDKFLVYLLASQLALSSFPGSAIAASVGWMVGVAWRGEWGPGAWGRWRVPGWVVGEKKANTGQGLGDSGLKISKVILGAMSYGTPEWQEWVLDEEKSLPLLEHAYKVGLNTWDTVHNLPDTIASISLLPIADLAKPCRNTASPVKKWLFCRNAISVSIPPSSPISSTMTSVLTNQGVDQSGAQPRISAMAKNDDEMVNQVGLSRKHIFDAVDASVKRLGTYIDVLQIHRLDRDTPKKEIMKALNDVVESGKVRYIGASSMAAWEFQMLQNIAETNHWHRFISMQGYHNLIYREEEREMLPFCRASGVGCIPWSPVARGVLTRPWGDRSTKREETDNFLKSLIRSKETEIDKNIVNRLEEVAKKRGVGMAQVAIAWSIKQEGVNPIVGLGSKERIDQAVEAVKFKLSDEEAKYLEEPYMPKVVQGY